MGTPLGADVSREPGRIGAMFDAISGRYDALNRLLSAGLDRRWRQQAVRSLRMTGRERLLDLCTGTGDVAIAALTGGTSARCVVGIDFSAAMLRRAGEKRAARRLPIAFVRADATRLPLADASMDAATIAFGIRNVADPAAACRDLVRVLRPGARLAILEFGLPTAPIVRRLYLWYFRRVLPLVGRVVSGHQSAYAYLPASVGVFPPPERFAALLGDCGFVDVEAMPLTLGIVYLYAATRPDGN